MSAHLHRVVEFARKELITLTSYRISVMMRVVNVWYFAISFYFIAEFVGDPASLAGLDGGYFDYVLVGSIVTSFATVGATSFPGQLSEEQDEGTLEAVLTTPTPLWTMLLGSFVVPMLFVVVEAVVLVVVGLGVFGAGMPLAGLAAAIPFLVLTTAAFSALGIVAGAFIVLVKRGDPFSGPVREVTLLLSGALYPVSVLPGWLEAVSTVIPATYGVRATRDLVQGDVAFRDTLDEAAILVLFTVVSLPLALALLRRAIAIARKAGTLGTY